MLPSFRDISAVFVTDSRTLSIKVVQKRNQSLPCNRKSLLEVRRAKISLTTKHLRYSFFSRLDLFILNLDSMSDLLEGADTFKPLD